MKGNEVKQSDIEVWKTNGKFPVSCRLCGEVWLFSSEYYSKEDFIGWECPYCTAKKGCTPKGEQEWAI
ncbi:MAG: hypothetical protein J6S14_12370 [Clostridia bacterium]|nr:hypothetical protein [Clostridia bacterium]